MFTRSVLQSSAVGDAREVQMLMSMCMCVCERVQIENKEVILRK